jgi:putative ABC transport system ATP-binding protein
MLPIKIFNSSKRSDNEQITSHLNQPAGSPLIRMIDVTKKFSTSGGELSALKGINLDIYPGEFIGIIGKSGAGKTTLINMVSGLDRLTSGEIWIGGVPVHKLSENQAAMWRGKNLGVVYQTFQLMPTLSVLRNITLAMDFNGLYRGAKSDKVALELLRQVELERHAQKLPSAVSGGQQQRIAIARALANNPSIIVADEPTGRLDTTTAETIFQIFEALVEKGKTILMVTHDTSFIHRFTRVLRLVDGVFMVPAETSDVVGVTDK